MDLKKYKVTKANAWNGWDPLKQVILGNVFDPDFFEDIQDPKLRDLLQRLLYETHEDLMGIKKTLEDLGVEVIQPPRNTIAHYGEIDNSNKFSGITEAINTNWEGKIQGLPKPCLMPRDYYVTLGDKVLFTGFLHEKSEAHFLFEPGVVDYWDNKGLIYRENGELSNDFWAPQLIRLGNRLIIDQEDYINLAEKVLERYPIFKGSKIAVGGHTDGSMNLPKPGLVVSGEWIPKETFKDTLPGWDVLHIENPNYYGNEWKDSWWDERNLTKGRWWHPEAKSNPDLVNYVDKWLNEWVGYAEETMFEVNMLSISEEIILSLNYHKDVHDKLKQHGIEPIYCRFRHRNFWDGGLHCLTLDTVREGGMQDYFK